MYEAGVEHWVDLEDSDVLDEEEERTPEDMILLLLVHRPEGHRSILRTSLVHSQYTFKSNAEPRTIHWCATVAPALQNTTVFLWLKVRIDDPF